MKTIKLIFALTMMFTIQAWGANQPDTSDFIGESPALTPIADMEDAWLWNKPGVQFKDYDKILLTDIEIFLAPDSKYDSISADQMKGLSDSMRVVLIEALASEYQVVSEPGPGVLEVRIAITDVYLGKPKHRLGQYTPIGIVFSGVKKLAGKSPDLSLKGASIEAELSDSQSEERLGVRIDTKPLRSMSGESEEMSWEATEESMKVYVDQFRKKV